MILQQILNGASTGAAYAIVAVGFGLVFSVMGVLNMAHPEIFTGGAYVSLLGSLALGDSFGPVPVLLLLILAAGLAGAAAGLVVEGLVIRPLRKQAILTIFIATTGVSIALQATYEAIWGSDPVSIPRLIPFKTWSFGDVSLTSPRVFLFVCCILLMAGIAVYVRLTRYGLASRAIAENPEAASACGVHVNRVSQMTMAIASGAAGIAGVAIGQTLNSAAPGLGLLFGVKAFVCMLVAGNRRIEGIVAVGFALGIIESLVTVYVSSSYRDALTYGILLAVLVFRPSGIFGSYPHVSREG